MGWRPRLNVICTRCGKPGGWGHVCVSNSARKQSIKPKLSFGSCPKCRRRYDAGGPLTHHCAPKSDFGKRRKQYEKEQRDKARKARGAKHDYTNCPDRECKKSLCVAYKSGLELGDQEGHARGWEQGYDRGAADARNRK